MKKIGIILSLAILLGLTSKLSAQNYSNKQLALISYEYNIHQNIKPQFDEFAYLFPEPKEKKADKTTGLLKEKTWYLLKERLEEGTGMYILPLNAHGNDFKYDAYGFPEMNINRAIRKGNSKYYIKIDVTISAYSTKAETGYGSKTSKDSIENEDNISENAIIPEITIEVTTYSNEGIIPMQKVTGKAIADEPWEISVKTFDGLKKGETLKLNDPHNIMGLINSAITNLLENF
ncbi:MAG TPA: hypothetical protein PLV65_05795 [Tenuifilaceae bacterium]|nr:hypothetical protein [Tenuifilaceae bacterium]